MNIHLLGETIDLIGKLFIAYTAVRVHHRFWQEHKVDENVFTAMKREQKMAIAGMVLMIIGYLVKNFL